MKIRLSSLFIFSLLLTQIACSSVVLTSWSPDEAGLNLKKVRVFLGNGTEEEIFKTEGEILVRDANELPIKRTYDFLSVNASVLKAPIFISSPAGFISYKGVNYRGEIHLKPTDSKVLVLNVVPVEEYLLGVVPSEVSASWPMEALKAQAICARTYVLREMMNKRKNDFDVDTSTNSQVYRGKQKEHKRTSEAVWDTEGLILVYKGQPIQSFFHSNSGGITEDPANVWGNSIPYLKSVNSDFDKDGEQYSWEDRMKPNQINSALASLGIGEIVDIVVISRFPSARVNEVEIIGNSGTKKIKGTEFRKLIGATKMKSTRFGIRREDSGDYYIKGLGSGHGVGMSQWGSFVMAKNSYNFKEILSHYYRGVDFARISL